MSEIEKGKLLFDSGYNQTCTIRNHIVCQTVILTDSSET